MNQTVERHERGHLADPAAIAMAAFALPLFVWSAFNADFFDAGNQTFIIPLAVFFGGPVALAAAMWAFHRRDAYLATVSGLLGSFWITYGMLLWLIQQGVVVQGADAGDLRGLFFAAWAVTFGILWLASMREHWALSLVTLGAGTMFVLLSIAYYADRESVLNVGGWIGFVTAGLAWYTALAEMLNAEFAQPVLPTNWTWFDRFRLGTRTR
jgi:succinate-acetate transporter protein